MNTTYLLIGGLIFICYYLISTYNWFQTALTRITASIQDIGNQLKRQASLIPNLESSVKSYLKHERDIYNAIVSARKLVEKADGTKELKKINEATDALGSLVPKLQVLVESNPELKGEAVVSKLMDELRDTSDKLLYARRVVIDLSADYNQKLVAFPTNFVGKWFGFKTQAGLATPTEGTHLAVSADETKDVKVSL